MKLKQFTVSNFRSIWNSGPVDVDDRITCLVGKNESGKTALLQALHRSHPVDESSPGFDTTYDYPKREVEDYRFAFESGQRSPAVVESQYVLDEDDKRLVADLFGPDTLKSNELTYSVFYDNPSEFAIDIDEGAAMKHLASNEALSPETRQVLGGTSNWGEFLEKLKTVEQTEAASALAQRLGDYEGELDEHIFENLLWPRCPRFMYFDEYYQMQGCANVNALIQRQESSSLKPSDHPLLGLIRLARLELEKLPTIESTADLKNRLEGAGNHLTRQVVKHWSQNKHIQMKFDVRDAKPNDPDGMQQGVNIWGEVYDTVHMAHTSLDSRSRGFVWFFSFLAWYEDLKRQDKNVILLLDEPGLSLHGRAQGDLLRYFETQLTDRQILYTTHSPFMIDPNRLERVRIVQDRSVDSADELPREDDGTKVLTDVLGATDDSLFPLQGALGYDIQQSLLIGANVLLVEGPSDILYLQAMSDQLEREGKDGLSKRWTMVPVGGIGKVPVFASLLGSQKGLKVVALLDVQSSGKQIVDRIYKEKLLSKRNVLTYAQFLDQKEADVEDLLDRALYIDLVNKEFKLSSPIEAGALNDSEPRTVVAMEKELKQGGHLSVAFSHYRPARFFMENAASLWPQISDERRTRNSQDVQRDQWTTTVA